MLTIFNVYSTFLVKQESKLIKFMTFTYIMIACTTFDVFLRILKMYLHKITVLELENTLIFKYFKIKRSISLVKPNRGYLDTKAAVPYSHISKMFQ